MPIRRLYVLAVLLLFTALTAPAADYIQYREGLGNSFRKIVESQKTHAPVRISYFGGSITAGAGSSGPDKPWRALLQQHLKSEFPDAALVENYAAIGGTGSWLGAFRTRNQALNGGAALVIVEFAVNDMGAPEAQVIASMEGIVRQIWQTDPTTNILFVYTMTKQTLEDYRNGKIPSTVQWHEHVAAHYGIPSVNMGAYAAGKIIAGDLTIDDFTKDGVHPMDRGYALYFDSLKPFIAQCKSKAGEPGEIHPHILPAPLSPAPMEKASCVPCEWANLEGPWKPGQKSPVGPVFPHVLETDDASAVLTVRFKGSQCGLFDAIGPDTGDVDVSLDNGEWKHESNWDHYAKGYTRAHSHTLVQGLDPAQWHELKLRVSANIPDGSKGRFVRIGYFLVDGDAENLTK